MVFFSFSKNKFKFFINKALLVLVKGQFIMRDLNVVLIYLAIKHHGNWNAIYQELCRKELEDEEYMKSIIANLSCDAISFVDPRYPDELKKIYHPPFALFYYGDISLIKDYHRCISIVGTREPTSHGVEATNNIIKGLYKGLIVVSGMASGIDSLSHKAAIENGLRTVAVLGQGINICFPTENEELYAYLKCRELIISEYPPNTPPTSTSFLTRNRIIAGLSKCVLVTEARRRSGSVNTISWALNKGNDVLCVPSSILNDSGCNKAIKDGAFLVEDSEDVNMHYLDLENYYVK